MTVILMLLTILFFISVDYAVQRLRTANAALGLVGDWLRKIPRKVALAVNHTWIRPGRDGIITIGLDSLLADLVGSSATVLLPNPGSFISHDAQAAKLGIGKNVLGIAFPVSGCIVETNRALLSKPSLLRSNPYGEGWLMKVRPLPSKNQAGKFLVRRKSDWLRRQALSVREFLATHGGTPDLVAIQDGGLPVEGALALLDEISLTEFGQSFITLSGSESSREGD